MPSDKYHKNGEFTPVSWDAAFTVMAEKFKDALKKRGPSGVGMLGSGQWTIWEGYAGLNLMKAGFRSPSTTLILSPDGRHMPCHLAWRQQIRIGVRFE